MDSNTVQFVVNALAEHYKFDAVDAARVVMLANARDVPAYQKAVAAIDATKAKIEEMKTKIAEGKPRKGSDLPAKLAELEKKREEQQARADEIAANVGVKKKRAPKTAPAPEAPAEGESESEKEAPAAPAAPAPAPKAKKDVADKRIKRMSPALVKQLTNVFDETKTAMTKEHPAQFAKYVNELVKEDFDEKSLTDHMRAYVATIGGALPKDAPASEEIPAVSVADLATMKAALVEAYGPGVYWNSDSKTFIKGPDADEDEDVTETTMGGNKYAVGDKTRRVYREIDGVDVFEGFLGIGKFATMTV